MKEYESYNDEGYLTIHGNSLWKKVQEELKQKWGFHETQSSDIGPMYVYDLLSIKNRVEDYSRIIGSSLEGRPFSVHYAVKANPHRRILQTIQEVSKEIESATLHIGQLKSQSEGKPESQPQSQTEFEFTSAPQLKSNSNLNTTFTPTSKSNSNSNLDSNLDFGTNLGSNLQIETDQRLKPQLSTSTDPISSLASNGQRLHNLKYIGVDIVSGGEMTRALEAGVPAHQIVFSGVAKSKSEIHQAIEKGVGQFNVESISELIRIGELSQGKEVSIVLRFNPNVDAKTHPYIATGIHDNKFGMDEDQLEICAEILSKFPHLKWKGLSCHIGSQILDVSVFHQSIQSQKRVFKKYQDRGFPLQVFNLGGGLGIDYSLSANEDLKRLKAYADVLTIELKNLDAHFQFEPGRFLVARFGLLLTQIEYIKSNPTKKFIICNSGMNHLLRPALYGARHRILPVYRREGVAELVDVVGPVCESSDFFAKNSLMSGLQEGDWLCIMDAGAYGSSMASQYNLFESPKDIFI